MSSNRLFSAISSLTFLVVLLLLPTQTFAQVYELRTYTTNEGKLNDLQARFRNHTVALFTKHKMESVGYWVPTEAPQSKNTLIYILRHKSRDAAKASWKAFLSDPQWREVAKKSEANGRILAKRPDSVYMNLTDYSPTISSEMESNEDSEKNKNEGKENNDAVFELRIYKANEGKLDKLNASFRNDIMTIFKRHQMVSVGYWTPTGPPDSHNTLIYILRHENRDAAKKSWKSFGSDPQWRKVAAESQKDGRILSERPQSIYMEATDYSAIR